jgi:hypothetical protein
MKKNILLITLLVTSTGVLSSAVLVSQKQKKAEEPMVIGFVKNDHGFKRDLGVAD